MKTSFNITADVRERLGRLAARHFGKMSQEIGWLVTLGEVYLDLAPDEKEVIDMIIDERVSDEQE